MKKFLIILTAIIFSFVTCEAFAQGNMPYSTPSDKYKKKVTYPTVPSYPKKQMSTKPTNTLSPKTTASSSSSPLSAEAKRVLSAAISRNNSAWNSAMDKMIEKGGIPGDTNVMSKCPRNPKVPSITVNGKTMKGNVCAKMTYTYKGQSYEEGFCK